MIAANVLGGRVWRAGFIIRVLAGERAAAADLAAMERAERPEVAADLDAAQVAIAAAEVAVERARASIMRDLSKMPAAVPVEMAEAQPGEFAFPRRRGFEAPRYYSTAAPRFSHVGALLRLFGGRAAVVAFALGFAALAAQAADL